MNRKIYFYNKTIIKSKFLFLKLYILIFLLQYIFTKLLVFLILFTKRSTFFFKTISSLHRFYLFITFEMLAFQVSISSRNRSLSTKFGPYSGWSEIDDTWKNKYRKMQVLKIKRIFFLPFFRAKICLPVHYLFKESFHAQLDRFQKLK